MPTIDTLRACRAFLLDMDGTIYVGDTLIPGAREFIATLEERGLPHLFLTNNSSRRGQSFQERLQRLGIQASRDRILTSGDATIGYLLHCTPHRSAYLVGTPELESEFREAGVELTADDPDCVVLGFDTSLTFEKLEIACRWLFADKPYYATSPDRTCITPRGLIPDIGAIIAACEAVTGRTPHIIGKPQPEIVADALRRLDATAATTAIVGDQLDTDMAMAQASELCGVLVMSGETSAARVSALPDDSKHFLVAESVADITRWLRA